MASQHPGQGIESQDAVQVTRVGSGREAEGSRSDIDQQLFAIDKRLYEAVRSIGASRKNLYASRVALAAYEHAYIEEQKARLQYAGAYQALHEQHQRVINDMSQKCLSLQEVIGAKESEIKEYERRLSNVTPGKDNKGRDMSEGNRDMVELAIAKKEELEARVTEFETEKSEMMQEHQNEKCKMVQEHQNEKCKMVQEHQNEKYKMVEEHQNALINAANRISAAEGKISELEEMHRTAKSQLTSMGPTASPEPIVSPCAGKRKHEENSEKQVPTRKGRKRRGLRVQI
ncbi:hypothetical protein K469DRAFT_690746 [Zopfia rhizophila CBS 207.26]|uniref:Uncharacterized protein n=1 Tax=Zopfia rhizophila CBS 207.26 TaxID=1314779 RepID=A0A6A6DUC2_9PEZI|nr:hypothetical protein K469DRAFT_690746 [Zopfia rhizophila CBS 207.26]